MFKGHINTGLARWAIRQPANPRHLHWRGDGHDRMGAARMGIISFIFALAEDMLLAAIPAVGFAMVFIVPQRALCAGARCWGRLAMARVYDHDERRF